MATGIGIDIEISAASQSSTTSQATSIREVVGTSTNQFTPVTSLTLPITTCKVVDFGKENMSSSENESSANEEPELPDNEYWLNQSAHPFNLDEVSCSDGMCS